MMDGKKEIVYISTDEIKPYENNPRDNTNAIDKVKASIEKFGFLVPLVISRDGVLITGHTRLEAAKELGLEKLPCVLEEHLTEAEEKAYRIIDNKTAEMSDWDHEKLQVELQGIELEGFELVDLGFHEMRFYDESVTTAEKEYINLVLTKNEFDYLADLQGDLQDEGRRLEPLLAEACKELMGVEQ